MFIWRICITFPYPAQVVETESAAIGPDIFIVIKFVHRVGSPLRVQKQNVSEQRIIVKVQDTSNFVKITQKRVCFFV